MPSLSVQVLQVEAIANEFVGGLVDAAPRLLTGLVFFVLAYVAIRIVRRVVRSSAASVYAHEPLIVDLVVLVTSVFLWFGTGLTLLEILGLEDIAASLGTAAGFAALGVSYALSSMIADTVAGVYLLRDPDFNPGDTVTTDAVTGTVTDIDLRKSRIELENGDVVVLANREVEKKWTKRRSATTAEG